MRDFQRHVVAHHLQPPLRQIAHLSLPVALAAGD
jgi:hypothetical protein